MSNLINGYTLEQINAYRADLIEEAMQDAADCKRLRYPDMVDFYEQKAENYRFAPVFDIANLMVYKGF